MYTATSKTCPDCGATNDAGALFCEECGTSLAAVSTDDQATSAFAPVWQAPVGSPTTTIPVAAVAAPSVATYEPIVSVPGYVPQEESIRGAVLGWIAVVLMLVVVGFYFWSTVLSDATRDRFTGFF